MANYFDMDQSLVVHDEGIVRIIVRRELGKHYLDIYGTSHKRFKINCEAYQSIVDQAGDLDV